MAWKRSGVRAPYSPPRFCFPDLIQIRVIHIKVIVKFKRPLCELSPCLLNLAIP